MLCESLCRKLISEGSTVLLQVGFVEPTSYPVLEAFLLQVVLLLSYKTSKHYFVLPANCRLYFELQNTLTKPWVLQSSVLKYLPVKKFDSLENFSPSGNEELVLGYLQAYSQNDPQLIGEKVGSLSSERWKVLITCYFISKSDTVSYRSVVTFLKFIYSQLKGLKSSAFLPDGDTRLASLRPTIFKCLLQSSYEYTMKSTKFVGNVQIEAARGRQIDAQADMQCPISWESSNHSNVFFSPKGELVFIYKDPNKVDPALKDLLQDQLEAQNHGRLLQDQLRAQGVGVLPQRPLNNREVPLRAQRSKPLHRSLDLGEVPHDRPRAQEMGMLPQRPLDRGEVPHDQLRAEERKGQTQLSLPDYAAMNSEQLIRILADIYCPERQISTTKYVMTPDDFLKMNLIYTRMIAGIPIICMGESGCGKTRLLRFLVNTLLGEALEVVNVHAGTTTSDIVERMAEIQQQVQKSQKRVWVFFDEFNTSSCVGVVSDIMCDRRLDGENLQSSLVFVAACNPYRLKPQSMLTARPAGIKRKHEDPARSQLLHVVKPLPESVLEYVWDFGALVDNDLRRYIEAILQEHQVDDYHSYVEAIFAAHKFIGENEDVSSISLRDVKRFTIIYTWLKKAMETKRQKVTNMPGNVDILPAIRKAGIVAFYLCYIIRISDKSQRDQLISMATSKLNISETAMKDTIETEQHDLLARMKLATDIVSNVALRENLYTLFVCIYNRIPVILCGKPGCSKSLAYQYLFDHCRGRRAADEWIKKLPELVLVYFQGSDFCTSDAVLRSFARAKKMLVGASGRLPVVVFDEVGLAELSPHNPLKVLHKELELDNAEDERGVSFVGVSNWALDASKMNRMLHLSRPDPNNEDLQNTAVGIFNALAHPETKRYSRVAIAVAQAYIDLKNGMRGKDWEDFFGLRDFYHIIKLIARSFNQLDNKNIENIAKVVCIAVQRNFGGQEGTAEAVWENISRYYQPFNNQKFISCGVLDLITANLADKDARYMMLIANEDLAEYVLEKKMSKDMKERATLVGSTLPGDQSSDSYARRCLGDIIMCMQRGLFLILKDMDQVYSSLYDLFNQNFKVTSMGKYCRVAIGSSFQPRCFVHDDFRVILIANDTKDSILSRDAPFLNRFEKYIFDIDLLLTPEKNKLVHDLDTWVNRLLSPASKPIVLSTMHIFPLYSKAAVQLSLLNDADRVDSLFAKIQNKVIATATKDLLVLAELSQDSRWIKKMWRESHVSSFQQLVAKILESHQSLFLVFTYSFDRKAASGFTIQFLAACDTEKDFTNGVKKFLDEEDSKTYCLVMDYMSEHQHLSFVKHTLERLTNSSLHAKRFVLIVELQRNIDYHPIATDFSAWEVHTFSNTRKSNADISDEMLAASCEELITKEGLFNFAEQLKPLAYAVIFMLKYVPGPRVADKSTINRHMFHLIENIDKHSGLVETLRQKVYDDLHRAKNRLDWKQHIFYDKDCVSQSKDLDSAILFLMKKMVKVSLVKCLFVVEKQSAMRSFFVLWNEPDGRVLREIWLSYFSSVSIEGPSHLQRNFQSFSVPFDLILNFPFSKCDYHLLMNSEACASKEKFSETFARSVTRGFGAQLSSRLQLLYLRDLSRITVAQQNLPTEAEELLLHLVWSLCPQNDPLVEKVWGMASNLQFIIRYSRYVLLCAQLLNEKVLNLLSTFLPKNALARLPECDDSLPEVLQAIDCSGVSLKDENEHIEIRGLSQAAWKEDIISILDKSITLLYPTKRNANQRPGNKWEIWLFRFEKILLDFKVALPNLSMFQTLIRFPSFSKDNFDLFVNVCTVATANPNESIFQSKKHSKKILTKVKEMQTGAEQATFLSYFLSELIKHQPKRVAILDSKVNTAKDFWRHCAVAMESLVTCSAMREASTNLLGFHGQDFPVLSKSNLLLVQVEKGLKMKSHFAVLLSDRCLASLPQAYTETMLSDCMDSLTLCVQTIETLPKELPRTKSIVALAFLKWVLKGYCWLLVNQAQCTDTSAAFRSAVAEVLSRNQTLKRACTIHLNTALVKQGKCFLSFLNTRCELGWLTSIREELQTDKDYKLYFYFQQGELFLQVCQALRTLRDSENEHDKQQAECQLLTSVNTVASPHDKLQVALAFVAQVSLFRKSVSQFQAIGQALTNANETMNEKLGSPMVSLLHGIIENFTASDFACIPVRHSEAEMQYKVAIHCYLCVLTAYAGKNGCLTSIFFNSDCTASGSNFRSLYIPGAPHDRLYEYLYQVSTRPENFDASSWNACGEGCDYIYPIGNCGQPMMVSTCPYCSRKIGGEEHKLFKRPGHRMLVSCNENPKKQGNKASELAGQRVQQYLSRVKPGMSAFDPWFESSRMRGISQLSYALLNFFVNCGLNFLAGWCEDEGFRRAVPLTRTPLDHFKEQLQSSQQRIEDMLSCSDGFLWIFKVISALFDFLQTHTDVPRTAEVRAQFERDFDVMLVQPNIGNLVETIRQYRLSIPNLVLASYEEMDAYVADNPHIRFFRITREPNFALLKSTWELNAQPANYPLLDLAISAFKSFEPLRAIAPILCLTKYLAKKYSHRLGREAARETPIQACIEQDPALGQLFNEFLQVWPCAKDDLAYKCQHLPPIEFTPTMGIHFFLLDKNEAGGGLYMAAALYTLAEKQNKLLEAMAGKLAAVREVPREEVLDTTPIPIQQILAEQVLQCALSDPAVLHSCFSNNPAYGSGQEVVFDYHGLEHAVLADFQRAKLLLAEDLHFFQYQNELFALKSDYSSLIIDVRNAVPQRPLTPQELEKLQLALRHLQRNSRCSIVLQELHDSLEYVLCIAKNEKITGIETINGVARKYDRDSQFKVLADYTDIGNRPVHRAQLRSA